MKKYILKAHNTPEFIKESLDADQLNAVENSVGRSLIVAGPGSGKTRIITYKIAYLVSQSIKPENILLVTFTRAASREMIERAKRASGSDLKGMLAGTFHHVCNHFIRKYSKVLNLSNNFTILDREDARDMVKFARGTLIEEIGKTDAQPLPTAGVLQAIYSYAVNCMVSLQEAIVRKNKKFMGVYDEIEEIWKRYTQLKDEQNAVDYDDIIVKALTLFQENPQILEHESARFKWILVDEFQDTNILQFQLVELLSKVHGNLIVVGDDSQSIYSFRGARFENVYDFLKSGDSKVFKIQTNYRSNPEIVTLVNNIVPTNSIEKNLKAVRKPGAIPVLVETWDNMEEAAFVAQKIDEHINDGVVPEQIAVLYRSHYHSLELQMELDKRKIAYTLFSGPKFVETAHVKDIMAFIRVLQNPLEQLSWGRLLRLFPGVGSTTAIRITMAIAEAVRNERDIPEVIRGFKGSRIRLEILANIFEQLNADERPSEIVSVIYNTFYGNYLDGKFPDAYERRQDIERLIEIADRYQNIGDFLEDLAISEKVDMERDDSQHEDPKIILTTVHQAKGLEWDVVFILAVNPGDFPSGMAITENNLDEEERIFYVAVTRAKDYLYIIRQRTGRARSMRGNTYVFRSGTDLLYRIPQSAIEKWDVGWGL